MSAAILRARGLAATAGSAALLRPLGLDLSAGRVLAVLGPSGSGKSTLGLALLGEAASGVTLTGSVRVGGSELLGGTEGARRAARAGRVGHLPQHPGAALDPVRRVGSVLDELAALVHPADRAARRAAVSDALRLARLPTGREITRRHPHQLSGGEAQRAALAQTLVTAPDVVVLDEPTTGLDPATTADVVDNLAALAAGGTALVLLTHDLEVARALAHDVLRLDEGRVVRRGPAAELLDEPPEPPAAASEATTDADTPRLVATGLRVRARDGTPVLDDVGVTAPAGGCLAVVGRSGAGKTTLARCLAGLIAPRAGTVEVDGRRLAPDLVDRDATGRRAVQYVHQDPRPTFLAHRPGLDQVARPGVLLRGLAATDARAEAEALLGDLGVAPDTAARRPGGLSGGQLQRAAVARAMLAGPDVLVGDEITSALDAEHRASLLAAVDRVRRDRGTTLVLVSHDLALVGAVADAVVLLDRGRVVESGPAAEVLAAWGAEAALAGS